MNDTAFLPFLRYSPAYTVAPFRGAINRVVIRLSQVSAPSIHHGPCFPFVGVVFKRVGDKPIALFAGIHRPSNPASRRFPQAVREESMTGRKRFAFRSPARWSGIHPRTIRHVEPNIPAVKREAAPVAIDSPKLFS